MLTLLLLALANSVLLALLDLFDDDSGTTTLGFNSQLLTLVLSLESLQTLDFHHDVEALLFFEPLSLKGLVLRQLAVTNSYNLSVQSHLVHELHIVVFFVELLLGLSEETIGTLVLLDLNLGGRQFLGPLSVHLHHLLLAGFGKGLLLLLLLLLNAFLLSGILLRSHHSLTSHTGDVSLGQDSSFTSGILAGLLDVSTHLAKVIVAHDSTVHV